MGEMPNEYGDAEANLDADERLESNERTSNSLIDGLKDDRAEAWERLVELYSPLVYFWCQESGLARADLNDIFQDVFHALARNIKKYQTTKSGSFRGWLRTVTRNKVADHFRKAGKQATPIGGTGAIRFLEQMPEVQPNTLSPGMTSQTSSQSLDPSRELEIQQVMLRKALANIRSHFQEKTWQAFWLVAIDGRSVSDVAADLEMKPGTVRVAKSRVLKRLRLEVGEAVD